MYINCHTYYSLRYGTIKPEELLRLAAKKGIETLALTDINTTSACLDIVRLAANYAIKPVLGVDFRNKATQQFMILAKNNLGFQHINQYLAGFLHTDGMPIPNRAKQLAHTIVIYPFQQGKNFDLKENEFLGVRPTDVSQLQFSKWHNHRSKLVILKTVSFQDKKSFNAHRLLRAIANNTLLSKLEANEQGKETDIMLSKKELLLCYKEYPELVENTLKLLADCHIHFNFSRQHPNNQKSYTATEELDFRLLKKLAYDGLPYRYKNLNDKIVQRLHKELEIVRQKKFVSYFLVNWKILKYARSKNYYYVGRGSGANSIVAYLLRITDVDPIELDLYFERFINLYRKNPPDFDIDFSWRDRDDIINFIFTRFKNTSLITVYNTFKHKASVRELGKVFGLPKSEIDKLAKGRYNLQQLDSLSKLVLVYSKYIQGFPNYLGIHAGGILIAEKSIHYYTATFLPPKGFATTQFDMVVAEDIGLYKFDILSQRGLGKIKEAVEIVKYNRHIAIDIHDIKRFKEDTTIKEMLKNAKAIGCFYVESPAMRMLLKKLQVDNYLGLVAASSVIRPGVAKSGMMREYILRYRHPARRKDAHPILLDIMPETYGVMVYQEDVIKVAHYFGGLSLGEADMLRRGMSGKFRSRDEFLKVKSLFFENCKDKGHPLTLTKEIWRQIESFAGYAFAKGHSASYAVESYQSLFLKAHYPLEFMVACINNFGGFYTTEIYIHEAKMYGATILPPCVNHSKYETIIKGKTIYLGFLLIRSFEALTAKRIVKERLENGPFKSLDDFIDRLTISIEQLAILIKLNAFKFTRQNKRELLWEAHLKVSHTPVETTSIALFKTKKKTFKIPTLSCSALEDSFDEMEYLGFTLQNPFRLLVSRFRYRFFANDLYRYIGSTVAIHGYYVSTKNTRTSKGDMMFFGTFIDVKGYFIDTVHFPSVARKYPFRGSGVYLLVGKVIEEFDAISLEISQMEKLAIIQDPRYAEPSKKRIVC